jgi:hypothetical protein
VKLKAGVAGKSQIQVKAKGGHFAMPALGPSLTGPLTVQLSRGGSSTCWQAVYGAPFGKNDGATFSDKSD